MPTLGNELLAMSEQQKIKQKIRSREGRRKEGISKMKMSLLFRFSLKAKK